MDSAEDDAVSPPSQTYVSVLQRRAAASNGGNAPIELFSVRVYLASSLAAFNPYKLLLRLQR